MQCLFLVTRIILPVWDQVLVRYFELEAKDQSIDATGKRPKQNLEFDLAQTFVELLVAANHRIIALEFDS